MHAAFVLACSPDKTFIKATSYQADSSLNAREANSNQISSSNNSSEKSEQNFTLDFQELLVQALFCCLTFVFRTEILWYKPR